MGLFDKIGEWGSRTPDSAAVVFGDETISFKQLKKRSTALAHLLYQNHQISNGDRIAYLGLNDPSMLSLLLACDQLGAVFTPLNSRLALREYQHLLHDSRPSICFFDNNFKDIAEKLSESGYSMIPVESMRLLPTEQDELNTVAKAEDPLLLVYTSGTTGRPKGVVLSKKAVDANIENCNDLYNFKPGDQVQITLPLFHVGGLCILLLPALTNGATIHLHKNFDPSKTLNDIAANQITTSIFVPAQMAAMMSNDHWHSSDLSSMKYVVVGSSIIPKDQIKKFHSRGIPVSQIYGATETGPAAIGLALEEAMDNEGAAGRAVKLCKAEVRAADGQACSTGTKGEIWIKGDNILSEYWQQPEETTKVLIDGWYNTGDIGFQDDRGFYWIVDRSKDMIISGGENIYPAEIESASLDHPAISAIAVVAKKDDKWGETPVAAVELMEGRHLELVEYQDFLAPLLARYKQPKEIIIYDQLPRNGMGKIEKSVIRKQINT